MGRLFPEDEDNGPLNPAAGAARLKQLLQSMAPFASVQGDGSEQCVPTACWPKCGLPSYPQMLCLPFSHSGRLLHCKLYTALAEQFLTMQWVNKSGWRVKKRK